MLNIDTTKGSKTITLPLDVSVGDTLDVSINNNNYPVEINTGEFDTINGSRDKLVIPPFTSLTVVALSVENRIDANEDMFNVCHWLVKECK